MEHLSWARKIRCLLWGGNAIAPVPQDPRAAIETPDSKPRVAYLMSRFPKLTETFILFEIQALEEQGIAVEIYPLWRERATVMHEEAAKYVARAHFRRVLSGQVLLANLKCLWNSPAKYLAALWIGLQANWGSLRYLLGFIASFPKAVSFAEEMQKSQIRHVHAHFASHPAAVALVIGRLTGIPFSFTAHGSDLHRDVHMLREKVAEASFVVAISDFNRQAILNECGLASASKIRVIHCGTDTRVFHAEDESPAPAGTLRLGCVGTLHEVKGQRFLVEACRLLGDRGLNVQANFIGNGPDANKLRGFVEQFGLQQSVIFHGSLPRQEVSRLLKNMHVLVAPSVPTRDGRREGIPVALMEGMASGLPVVASRISGIPELVTDRESGRLVPPGDPVALADALEELAGNSELRAEWGRAARAIILSRFDLHQNARQLRLEIEKVWRTPSVTPAHTSHPWVRPDDRATLHPKTAGQQILAALEEVCASEELTEQPLAALSVPEASR